MSESASPPPEDTLPPGSSLLTEARFHVVGSVRAGEGVYVDGVAASAGGGWDHFDRP